MTEYFNEEDEVALTDVPTVDDSNERQSDYADDFSNPWDDAPENTLYYEKIYDDGHLGSFTESSELAYKFGWFNNRISLNDVEKSEVDGCTYLKDRCPHKTQEQIANELVQNRIKEIQSAVQNLLDEKAQEKLYDDAFAICSYANSTDEAFHSEANQFISWRDRCWRKCYEILAQFQSGEIEMPTVEYVMNELPVLTWE